LPLKIKFSEGKKELGVEVGEENFSKTNEWRIFQTNY
jgi:hypothetical protein